MILLLDNYDSFTYNLFQYLKEIEPAVLVKRNDALSIQEIEALAPSAIIFSPGPGSPKDAGIMEEIIAHFYKRLPMLGICLGHQAIAEVFGSEIIPAKRMMHGEADTILIQQEDMLFTGILSPFQAGRYHSLIVKEASASLQVLATSRHSEIMAIKHQSYPVYGVQFHPESLLTPEGKTILRNFVNCIS